MSVPPSPAPFRSALAGAAVLVGLGMLGLAGRAGAQPPANGCLVSAPPLDFGGYNPFSTAPLTMDTGLTLDCSSSVKFASLTLSSGSSTQAGFRQLRSTNDRLAYNVYRDAQHTQVWDNGATVTVDMAKQGNLALMVYGLVPALQNVSAGGYSDTLTLTIATP